MTISRFETREMTAEPVPLRAPWTAPTVRKMRAGDAEDGIDPNTHDGLVTYS